MSIYSSPKPNLQLIIQDRPYIRCVHICLVIKMSSLEEKYLGGLRRFAERHTIRSNQDLVAVATMGDDDMGPIIDELYDAGLRPKGYHGI